MVRRLWIGCLFAAFVYFGSDNPALFADEESVEISRSEAAPVKEPESSKKRAKLINVAFKTRGGTQLWTDYLHRYGFRIQRNAVTGHWRLLDDGDVRRAWGTRQQCETVLGELRSGDDASGDKVDRYVVLLHGLMRSHHSMKPVETALDSGDCGKVIRFSYASTRSSIGDHAAALQEVLTGLPPDAQIAFVGHSMGNIVVRHLIGDLQQEGDPSGILDRCQCMVMLGPPNQGAAIARRLAPTGLFGIVTGKGGLELGPRWDQLVTNLAVPPFPFAIIAGDLSQTPVKNPLVGPSSDFVVAIDETHLDGHASFATVPVLHSLLMNDVATQQMVVDFLRSHR
ncbi:MAG: esterase/lipase family protein [Rubripirellula sp.]